MNEKTTVARVRGTERSIVVLGTRDVRKALAAAGMSTSTHCWGSTRSYGGGWTLHRDGTASRTDLGARPGVLFDNITNGDIPGA